MKLTLIFILMVVRFIKSDRIHFDCEYIEIKLDIIEKTISNCCRTTGYPKIKDDNDVLVPLNPNSGSNVDCFVAENKEFIYFPRKIENFGNTLQYVTIKNSGMKKVTAENLKSFKSMEYLDLSGNEIKNLEKNLFTNCGSLFYIVLANNKIQSVHPTAFASYEHYKYLDLRGNKCISDVSEGQTETLKLIKRVTSPESCLKVLSTTTSTTRVKATTKPSIKDTINPDLRKTIQELKDQIENFNNLSSKSSLNHLMLLTSNAICFIILIIVIIYLIVTKKSPKEAPKMKELEEEPSKYEASDYTTLQVENGPTAPEYIYQQQASYEEISYKSKDETVTINPDLEDFYAEIVNKVEVTEGVGDENDVYTVAYKSTDNL
ncbi:hypothetical protein ACKWTF_014158 [Chironomus riparius]